MKNIYAYLITALLSFPSLSYCQVFNGNATLTTQQEVDDFGANNYTAVTGKLTISGSSITDLSSLSTIQTIGNGNVSGTGLFIVNNDNLINLNGLNSVTTISGDLEVTNNALLQTLSGLNNVNAINFDQLVFGGGLYIKNNNSLMNLSGLDNLNFIPIDLEIIDNPSLTSISQLSSAAATQIVRIENNSSLASLSGLKAPTLQLYIVNNDALTGFQDANFTGNISENLEIRDNDNITNLLGFENVDLGVLVPITLITIHNNQNLLSLNGLTSNFVHVIGVDIDSNPLLSNIDILLNFTGGLIRVANSPNISSLSPLSNYLGGTVIIEGTNGFLNLTGFENITNIDVIKLLNTNLNSINQIVIDTVIGEVVIENNPDITSVSVFNTLETIQRPNGQPIFNISGNNQLLTLNGFENLITIDGGIVGQFKVENNGILNDFCALNNLFTNGTFDSTYSVFGNAYNPTQQDIINGNCTLSIESFNLTTINLYPNPVNNILHINTTEEIQNVTLYDVLGKEQFITFSNNSIDVSTVSKGIYFLQIQTAQAKVTKKIIKE